MSRATTRRVAAGCSCAERAERHEGASYSVVATAIAPRPEATTVVDRCCSVAQAAADCGATQRPLTAGATKPPLTAAQASGR
jgi:hypothetical protein